MKENTVLAYMCKSCKKQNYPHGQEEIDLPHNETVKCQFCDQSEYLEWLDSETKQAVFAKRLGVTKVNSEQIEILQNKILRSKSRCG